jgi:DNA-binding GntR family transcriptional regulator
MAVTERRTFETSSLATELNGEHDSSLPSGERVYQGLRLAILRGQLVPGARLVELNLAAEFGVSRTPVREALKRLSAEGLVTSDASRGLIVRGLSFREVEEIYEVREVLDGLATRLAARRISPQELAKLELLVQMMDEHNQRGDVEGLVQDNVRFHEVICEAARNDWLQLTVRGMTDFVRRFSHTSYMNEERNDRVLEEHRAVISALERGDGEAAERLARQHVVEARSFLARLSVDREGAF